MIIFGDGGVGMYISEIKIAIEKELPILFVLISDKGFGSILKRARNLNLNTSPLKIKNPSWLNIFKEFGVDGMKVVNDNDLDIALENWNKKPFYLECFFEEIDYENMVSKLRD